MFKKYNEKTTIDIINLVTPNIFINKSAIIKMNMFVNKCDDEIGWLGVAKEHNNTILIEDVLLFEQEVHSTTTEITSEGLTKFAEEILQEENGVELWNNLRVWGHSHVNMGVNPSGQDDSQMKVFKDNGHDWFIRIIANKKGELKLDFYNYTLGLAYQNIPWYILESAEEQAIMNQIDALYAQLDKLNAMEEQIYDEVIDEEIKKKVSKKSSYKWGTSSYNWNKTKETKVTSVTNSKKKEEKESKVTQYHLDGLDYETCKRLFTEEQMMAIRDENDEDGIFDNPMMLYYSECRDLNEVRETINLYGYDDVYEDDELTQIWLNAYNLYVMGYH